MAKEICGHINKQYINPDGALEDLKCTLQAGHGGDHKAEHKALREFSGMKHPAKTYQVWQGKEYELVTEMGIWSDAAGRSAEEVGVEMAGKREQLNAFIEANPGMQEEHKRMARELGLVPSLRA